ncbi:MAG: FAD-binding protein [Pseudomonadales bacterium]|nr:FAD-binding protein [Pseudomonadales bacterium]
MEWNHECQVVVVGSGNGGMTAALTSFESGVKDIILIEKSSRYGGSSSLSGGGVWIPCNHYALAAGAKDSKAEALNYLKQTIPDNVPEELLKIYLDKGPEMLEFLHQKTRVRYESLAMYPDYYTSLEGAKEGHRSLEPEPLMISELGDDWKNLQQTHHMMYLFDRIAFTQKEAHLLVTRGKGWIGLTTRLIWDYITDIGWRFKSRRSRRITNGCAGIARLRLSMADRNIPLWLNTSLESLITSDSGEVIGITAIQAGKKLSIRATEGVILAAGGFEASQKMREQFLPKPTNSQWSAGCKTNTGDAHNAAMAIGASTRQMDGAWWCTTFNTPGEPLPRLAIMEKSLPGSCVVNNQGKRIANESQNYMAYQLEFFKAHSEQFPCVPAWFVFDRRFREKYIVGPLLDTQSKPDFMIPQSWYSSGFLHKAKTIEELAKSTGINEEGLKDTINKMNKYAEKGVDEDFNRGGTAYDRYYGDETVKPNPCLAPLSKPPFYAMRIEPGDFGTQGGMEIDENARVLDLEGKPIHGLYAIGNCSAAVLPTYPGPGSTLGPAMTFGYLAAKDIARRATNKTSNPCQ